MDINQVILVGRLADNVVYQQGQGDTVSRAVGKLIVNRPPSQNSTKKAYDAIQIVAWGKHADNLANYTSKGKELAITGEIRTNAVAPTTPNGTWKNYTEVMVRSVSFGRDSNDAKMMKVLHGGNELVATAQGVQAQTNQPNPAVIAAMLAVNPELKTALETIVHGALPASTLEVPLETKSSQISTVEEGPTIDKEEEEDSTSVEAPFTDV